MIPNQLTLDDVLEAIMIEEGEPSYEAMNRWIARYPEYRSQLASYFATWAIQAEETEDPLPVDSEALASRGVSYALNLLNERDRTHSLLERARASNLSEKQLGEKTQLDDSMLQKLNRHLIVDIPQECIRRLAEAVGETLEHVRLCISGDPVLSTGRRFKAKKGHLGSEQEDFLTAVERSDLADHLKQEWISIVRTEKGQSEMP
jgi:hypothetical protein